MLPHSDKWIMCSATSKNKGNTVDSEYLISFNIMILNSAIKESFHTMVVY